MLPVGREVDHLWFCFGSEKGGIRGGEEHLWGAAVLLLIAEDTYLGGVLETPLPSIRTPSNHLL